MLLALLTADFEKVKQLREKMKSKMPSSALQSTLSREQRDDLHRLIQDIYEKMPTWLAEGKEPKDEINDMLVLCSVAVNDEQIALIIKNYKDTEALEAELVETYGKELNSKLWLSLKVAITLADIYYFPGMTAFTSFNAALKPMMIALFGNDYSAPAIMGVNFLLQTFLTQFAPQNVMNRVLPQLVESYGHVAYLLAPIGVLGYHLVSNTTIEDLKELGNSASDFAALMHGDLDEAEFQRIRREHPNCLATMTIDEVASYCYGMVSWMWKSTPKSSQERCEDESHVSTPPKRAARTD